MHLICAEFNVLNWKQHEAHAPDEGTAQARCLARRHRIRQIESERICRQRYSVFCEWDAFGFDYLRALAGFLGANVTTLASVRWNRRSDSEELAHASGIREDSKS
jgi:hypothetical protein